jgi:serine/threonine protein kinase
MEVEIETDRFPKFISKHNLANWEVAELKNMQSVYFYSAPSSTQWDDEDGYYMVNIGDHILYRFEVQKVLGKGSFAQVVSAFDHKTQCNVAIKINRNTEIDHKFAQAEANLLTFLMEEDPQDQHHIVRLSEHLQFREH